MTLHIQTIIRWLTGCLIFFISSCHTESNFKLLVTNKADSIRKEQQILRAFNQIISIKKDIRSGDLVTRTGNDFTSENLRKLCTRDKTYSHCGIASWEKDSLFIYHAVGGEWNPDEKLRRDSWELFAEPYSNRGVGVFRFGIPDSLNKNLLKVVQDHYLKGLTFDMQFDLVTDEKMYCAEFIYKSYTKASHYQMQFHKSHIGNFEFVGPDDLFLHPLCKKIGELVYK
jgi:hypothetical protein